MLLSLGSETINVDIKLMPKLLIVTSHSPQPNKGYKKNKERKKFRVV